MQNRFLICTAVILLALLTACGDSEKHRILNDFEAAGSWTTGMGNVLKGDAHSGHYAVLLDSSQEYSIAYKEVLNDVPLKGNDQLTVNVWTRGADLSGQLVVTVTDLNGEKVYYNSVGLTGGANQWNETTGSFKLPDNLKPEYTLYAFIWNTDKKRMLVDDFEIIPQP